VSIVILDGWLEGKLPGPRGPVPIKRFPQGPYTGRLVGTPNLVLHTTETAGYSEILRYPTEFQVGEGFIGQHKPLWSRGEGLKDGNGYALQVEIVASSYEGVWLPRASSLEPLVALVAFLHRRNFIKTGLMRPTSWPTQVDRRPGTDYPATDRYYRRHAGLWPDRPGVYGHLEIPNNDHWDPGGFNYPSFFRTVREVLDGEDKDVGYAEFKEGVKRHRQGDPRPGDNGDPDVIFGWQFRDDAVTRPAPTPGPSGPEGPPGLPGATHIHRKVEVAGPAE